jgi:hypothetical protein
MRKLHKPVKWGLAARGLDPFGGSSVDLGPFINHRGSRELRGVSRRSTGYLKQDERVKLPGH